MNESSVFYRQICSITAFAEGISKYLQCPSSKCVWGLYSSKTRALLEANKLSDPIVQTTLLAQEWRRKHRRRTLFLLPGPVLIMVYKLSPELLESGSKAETEKKERNSSMVRLVHLNTWFSTYWLRGGDRPTCRAWHDGSSRGTATSRCSLWREKRINNAHTSMENICTLRNVLLASNTTHSNVEIVLPHMHREREMSKASEKTKPRQGK